MSTPIPEGQSRELLLSLVERLGIDPSEVVTGSDHPVQIQIVGEQARISLTTAIPIADFLSIAYRVMAPTKGEGIVIDQSMTLDPAKVTAVIHETLQRRGMGYR